MRAICSAPPLTRIRHLHARVCSASRAQVSFSSGSAALRRLAHLMWPQAWRHLWRSNTHVLMFLPPFPQRMRFGVNTSSSRTWIGHPSSSWTTQRSGTSVTLALTCASPRTAHAKPEFKAVERGTREIVQHVRLFVGRYQPNQSRTKKQWMVRKRGPSQSLKTGGPLEKSGGDPQIQLHHPRT